jgi:5-methyltetrahydropteroyltriglutamate--homocysteine methyltransferase
MLEVKLGDLLKERMEGLTPGQPPAIFAGKDRDQFATFYADAEQRGLLFYTEETGLMGSKPVFRECPGPLRYKGHDAIRRDIRNLKAALEDATFVEAFMPVVAPGSIQPLMANRYYKTDDEYWEAIAKTMREEYQAIVDAGFILQVDDAFMPYLYDMVGPLTKADFLTWAGVVGRENVIASTDCASASIPK